MKRNNTLRLFSLIVLLILLVIIVIQNTTPVDVHFFFLHLQSLPVITVMLVSLLIGYILGLITYSLLFRGKKADDKKK
ncbi:MAG: LapA family protein [Brevinematales bacterium]|jgi:uncharacterized integral membrane protein